MEMTRRNFVSTAAAGIAAGTALVSTAAAFASESEEETDDQAAGEAETPSSPIDGAFTTKAMGHESWVNVTTMFEGDAITSCQVVSHKETVGVGSYACARIPAAIVANQSINVPNVHGASISSQAVKEAVRQAIELSGRNIDDYSAEITVPASTEHFDLSADVVIMGAGTAGLVTGARLAESGLSVILVEKLDFPGGSASMTMGGVQTAGSARQEAFDVTGATAGTAAMDLEAKIESLRSQVVEGLDVSNGELPFSRATYSVTGDMADWLSSIGVGFMTLGTYEGAASYGNVLSSAPGMYSGGAGYQTMFLANRIEQFENAQIIYSSSVTELIQDESGAYVGVQATSDNGATYTITARAVCLASGGFAKNPEMLQEYCPDHADQFFNCASSSTGDGIRMGLAAGSPMACLGRYMPAYLATAKSGVELAFIGMTAPGLFVNVNGTDLGSAVSHTNGEIVKLDPANEDTFYYVFDDSSACKAKNYLAYAMRTYEVIFEREEAVHYDSVEAAVEELGLPNLPAAIEANNQKAMESGNAGGWGAASYIETRDGIWVLPVTPNFYLTTAGLTIDVDCHLLDESGNPIPGLYAAGDVTASPEERDGIHYGFGYSTAMAFGWRMAQTLVSELGA